MSSKTPRKPSRVVTDETLAYCGKNPHTATDVSGYTANTYRHTAKYYAKRSNEMRVSMSESDLKIMLGDSRCEWCKHFTGDSVPLCVDHMATSANCDGCAIDGLCVCSFCNQGSHFILNTAKTAKLNMDVIEEKKRDRD